MTNFIKLFISKIISLILAISLCLTSTCYGIDLPPKSHLRVQMDLEETHRRMEELYRAHNENSADPKSASRNRDEKGRFDEEEGKSPEDMVRILYDSEYRDKPFTVREYRGLWVSIHEEELPERTAYNDLEKARDKGWIESAGERAYYRLTEKGRVAGELLSNIETLMAEIDDKLSKVELLPGDSFDLALTSLNPITGEIHALITSVDSLMVDYMIQTGERKQPKNILYRIKESTRRWSNDFTEATAGKMVEEFRGRKDPFFIEDIKEIFPDFVDKVRIEIVIELLKEREILRETGDEEYILSDVFGGAGSVTLVGNKEISLIEGEMKVSDLPEGTVKDFLQTASEVVPPDLGEVIVFGGAVRDLLLGKVRLSSNSDIDIVVRPNISRLEKLQLEWQVLYEAIYPNMEIAFQSGVQPTRLNRLLRRRTLYARPVKEWPEEGLEREVSRLKRVLYGLKKGTKEYEALRGTLAYYTQTTMFSITGDLAGSRQQIDSYISWQLNSKETAFLEKRASLIVGRIEVALGLETGSIVNREAKTAEGIFIDYAAFIDDSGAYHDTRTPAETWTLDITPEISINRIGISSLGRVYDPDGGVQDLRDGKLRFIGKDIERNVGLRAIWRTIIAQYRFGFEFTPETERIVFNFLKEPDRYIKSKEWHDWLNGKTVVTGSYSIDVPLERSKFSTATADDPFIIGSLIRDTFRYAKDPKVALDDLKRAGLMSIIENSGIGIRIEDGQVSFTPIYIDTLSIGDLLVGKRFGFYLVRRLPLDKIKALILEGLEAYSEFSEYEEQRFESFIHVVTQLEFYPELLAELKNDDLFASGPSYEGGEVTEEEAKAIWHEADVIHQIVRAGFNGLAEPPAEIIDHTSDRLIARYQGNVEGSIIGLFLTFGDKLIVVYLDPNNMEITIGVNRQDKSDYFDNRRTYRLSDLDAIDPSRAIMIDPVGEPLYWAEFLAQEYDLPYKFVDQMKRLKLIGESSIIITKRNSDWVIEEPSEMINFRLLIEPDGTVKLKGGSIKGERKQFESGDIVLFIHSHPFPRSVLEEVPKEVSERLSMSEEDMFVFISRTLLNERGRLVLLEGLPGDEDFRVVTIDWKDAFYAAVDENFHLAVGSTFPLIEKLQEIVLEDTDKFFSYEIYQVNTLQDESMSSNEIDLILEEFLSASGAQKRDRSKELIAALREFPEEASRVVDRVDGYLNMLDRQARARFASYSPLDIFVIIGFYNELGGEAGINGLEKALSYSVSFNYAREALLNSSSREWMMGIDARVEKRIDEFDAIAEERRGYYCNMDPERFIELVEDKIGGTLNTEERTAAVDLIQAFQEIRTEEDVVGRLNDMLARGGRPNVCIDVCARARRVLSDYNIPNIQAVKQGFMNEVTTFYPYHLAIDMIWSDYDETDMPVHLYIIFNFLGVPFVLELSGDQFMMREDRMNEFEDVGVVIIPVDELEQFDWPYVGNILPSTIDGSSRDAVLEVLNDRSDLMELVTRRSLSRHDLYMDSFQRMRRLNAGEFKKKHGVPETEADPGHAAISDAPIAHAQSLHIPEKFREGHGVPEGWQNGVYMGEKQETLLAQRDFSYISEQTDAILSKDLKKFAEIKNTARFIAKEITVREKTYRFRLYNIGDKPFFIQENPNGQEALPDPEIRKQLSYALKRDELKDLGDWSAYVVLRPTRSHRLFGDCVSNRVLYINQAFDNVYEKLERPAGSVLLQAGLEHELLHEALVYEKEVLLAWGKIRSDAKYTHILSVINELKKSPEQYKKFNEEVEALHRARDMKRLFKIARKKHSDPGYINDLTEAQVLDQQFAAELALGLIGDPGIKQDVKNQYIRTLHGIISADGKVVLTSAQADILIQYIPETSGKYRKDLSYIIYSVFFNNKSLLLSDSQFELFKSYVVQGDYDKTGNRWFISVMGVNLERDISFFEKLMAYYETVSDRRVREGIRSGVSGALFGRQEMFELLIDYLIDGHRKERILAAIRLSHAGIIQIQKISSWEEVADALKIISNMDIVEAKPLIIALITVLKSKNIRKRKYTSNAEDLYDNILRSLSIIITKGVKDEPLLMRQLAMSLPYAVRGKEALQDLWGSSESLGDSIDSSVIRKIRERIHGHLSRDDLKLVLAYQYFLDTGDSAQLADMSIAVDSTDIILQKDLQKGESYAEEAYALLEEIRTCLIDLFENGKDSNHVKILEQWESHTTLKRHPDILTRLSSLKERLGYSDDLVVFSESIHDLRAVVYNKSLTTSGADIVDFFQLDIFLERVAHIVIADGYKQVASDVEKNHQKILRLIELFTYQAMYSAEGSQYMDQWGELLTMPDITYSQVVDVLRALRGQVIRFRDHLNLEYRLIAREVLGDDQIVRIEQFMGAIQRDKTDIGNIDMFIEEIFDYIRGRARELDDYVYKDERAPIKDVPEFVHIASTNPRQLQKIRYKRAILGGKGTYLSILSAELDVPIPAAFIIPATIPKNGLQKKSTAEFHSSIDHYISILERTRGEQIGETVGFADSKNPMLVAVRSGSALGMPGILKTIINVGINDEIVESLAKKTKDERFAFECYFLFLQSYADAIWGIDRDIFQGILEAKMQTRGADSSFALSGSDMKDAVRLAKETIIEAGFENELTDILIDPRRQLYSTIDSIFDSWDGLDAVEYRRIKEISNEWQTPCIVQAYVFGNADRNSGAGIATSRDYESYGRRLGGEYSWGSQGNNIVAGSVIPEEIMALDLRFPNIFNELEYYTWQFENLFGTPQRTEFTVEKGKLWILQTSLDTKVKPKEKFLRLAPSRPADSRGKGAYGGGFRGVAVFDPSNMQHMRMLSEELGVDGTILFLEYPRTIDAMDIIRADSLLTAIGGITSHGAVIAYQNRKPAVVAVEGLLYDSIKGQWFLKGRPIKEGDIVSLDGATGEVWIGEIPLEHMDEKLERLRKEEERSKIHK